MAQKAYDPELLFYINHDRKIAAAPNLAPGSAIVNATELSDAIKALYPQNPDEQLLVAAQCLSDVETYRAVKALKILCDEVFPKLTTPVETLAKASLLVEAAIGDQLHASVIQDLKDDLDLRYRQAKVVRGALKKDSSPADDLHDAAKDLAGDTVKASPKGRKSLKDQTPRLEQRLVANA